MATEAQIAANKANAQKSTGPRTEAGKATTRKNAITHGLCTFITCMDDEDTDEMEALLADLMAEHQPVGPTEQILVYKMSEQFWLTKRAGHYLAWHSTMLESFNVKHSKDEDPSDEDRCARRIALYLRYHNGADRAFNRNLHDLKKLQKERKQRELEAEKVEIGSVPLTEESAGAESPANPPAKPFSTTPSTAIVEKLASLDLLKFPANQEPAA